MNVIINGQERQFPELSSGSRLAELVAVLGLKNDRVAVEHNGSIVSRSDWEGVSLDQGDRLEIVHFVGGGSCRGANG